MPDAAFELLLSAWLSHEKTAGKTLIVADEHAIDSIKNLAGFVDIFVVSNRFDVVEAAKKNQIKAEFSDFDFSPLPDGHFSRIIYRISKEKPVVHHVINEAWRMLAAGGELLLAGFKNDGTKTYIEKSKKLFGNGDSKKHGAVYLGSFVKTEPTAQTQWLETQNYPDLRLIEKLALHFFSKPGLFGWNKIDKGSAFLIDHLPRFLARCSHAQSLLDLGCGYGYLMLQTRHLPIARRVATDNNAAAVIAAQKNFSFYDMSVEAVADDCGSHLHEKFDVILCNPPFHQGFATDSALTLRFLQNIRRLLAKKGAALLVVNQFIPVERAASAYFKHVDILADNGQFKLVVLRLSAAEISATCAVKNAGAD